MKAVRCVSVAIWLALLATGSRMAAQEAGIDREADHAALRALMSDVKASIDSRDTDALAACLARQFVFTAVNQTVLTNAASIAEFYTKMLTGEKSLVKTMTLHPSADILTRFIDDNTGYCYGRSDDVYTLRRTGRTVVMPSRWTAVVVKEDGKWKIAAVHTGVNFLDNPVLDARGLSLWRKMLLGIGVGKYPGEP